MVWPTPPLLLSNEVPQVLVPLGSLHTRAKSCDHEIVRAQKKVSKDRPKTPPKSCSVVMDYQVYCEVIRDQASTKCYFNEFFSYGVLTHSIIERQKK